MGGSHSTESIKRSDPAFDADLQKWLQSPDDRFFLNIRAPNLLQVIDAPKSVLEQLEHDLGALAKSVRPIWRPNCFEIELYGSPFLDSTTDLENGTVSIDTVFCRFLSAMETLHWRPHIALNLSPFCDRSTCYFQKHIKTPPISVPDQISPKPHVVSVTFLTPSTVDISGSEDSCLDAICTIIESALRSACQAMQADKKRCVLSCATDCSRRLKVPCNLWKCVSVPDSVINRRFLLEIVAQLEHAGYQLSTCIDFRGNADTLFFVKTDHGTTNGHSDTYCMLSANRWDLLRLYEAPKDLVDVTRLLLNQHWPQGVDSESANPNWHEFQLCAFPWAARAPDAVQSHSMIASILQTYLARGWKPIASVQMSRTFKDRSCVILRKEKPAYRPHMCLGLLDSNELHLINAEDDLRDYVLDLVISKANVKGKVSKMNFKGGWPFLTLRGDPWCTISLANHQTNNNENGHRENKLSAYDYLEARAFVQKLLVALRFRGWDAVINVDLAARVKYKRKSSGNSSFAKTNTANAIVGEESIPLDVNSLILANVNGSRHNSFARSANESLFVIRAQLSVE